MTNKLYFYDSYKTEFTQRALEQEKYGEFFSIKFSDTFFYPTTGGQEHDLGTINNINVIDIIEQDDDILHIIEKNIPSVDCVCIIDWKRRFDFMQQHTGQHILSESIQKLFKHETMSSHLGEISCTIDIDTKFFDYNKMREIEEYANDIIYRNLKVNFHYVHDSEISKFPLRKKPKFTGELRIVEIDGFDYSACGGTHVNNTGEIGIIKIKKWEKVKGDLTRIEFLCGKRALKEYQIQNKCISDLANKMTISDSELFEKVVKLLEENKRNLKSIEQYKNDLLKYEAVEIFNNGINEKGITIIKKLFENREFSDIRSLAQLLIRNNSTIVLLGNYGLQNNIIMARSGNLEIDFKQLLNVISNFYELKGGGKQDFVQAGVNKEKMQEIIEFALRNLEI
jgi:alanyl-tRNA synthetase